MNEKSKVIFYKFGEKSSIEHNCEIICSEGISIGSNVIVQRDCWLFLPYRNFNGEPRIIIEDGCNIGRRCNISAANRIIIEKNVLIAPNVHITDHNHQYKYIGIPIMHQGIDSFQHELIIGEGTWIGINSVIVGNIRIGRGCVIGANSLVTSNIPDFCVVAGNPARVVKFFDRKSNSWVKVRDDQHLKQLENDRAVSEPLISICIPTYNRARELNVCLASIFDQIGNDNNFEVVISNNCSPDNTEDVVNAYKKRYSNIRYSKNESNIGATKNVAKVLKDGTGTYLMLHGDDDFFKPSTLYKIFNVINNNAKCGLFFLNVVNNDKTVKLSRGLDSFLNETSIYSTFISSLIYKRVDYNKILEPEKYYYTDINQMYMAYSLLKINPEFCLINDAVFNQTDNELSNYNFAQVFIKNYLDILNFFKNDGLSEVTINLDKKKILNFIFFYYDRILKKKLVVDLSDFDQILCEYYHNEEYYQEANSIALKIRERYKE